MNTKYYLTHITTEKNCQNILKTNNFIMSKHTKYSIQWLGDGIYFWSGNEKDALKLGKKMVKGKLGNKNENTKNISIKININEENHINLDNKKWENKFIEFVRKIYPTDDTLLRILEINKQNKNLNSKELNSVGKIFGDCINSFLKVLAKKYQIKIDLVSHYFYHKKQSICYMAEKNFALDNFVLKVPN